MTTGQQMMPASQTGGVNMKVIMYMMPIMMLFFFNNYASGLSLYYFIIKHTHDCVNVSY